MSVNGVSLEISNRPPIAQVTNIEESNKRLNPILLFFGILFIWITYGSNSIASNVLQIYENANSYDILLWISSWRFIGNICAMILLYCIDKKSKDTVVLNKISIVSMMLPLAGQIGWFCFLRLLNYGEISLINPLTNLYIIVPIVVSTLVQKKKFTILKIIGSILAIVSGCLFGIVTSSTPSILSWWEQTLYFLTIFVVWGFVDTISAIMGSGNLSLFGIMFFNSVGYLFCGLVWSFFMITSQQSITSFSLIRMALTFTNLILPFGWLTYVYLSKHDASIVTPLFSLNFILPVIYGIVFNNEEVSALKIFALVLTGITVMIIGKSVSNTIEKNNENKQSQEKDSTNSSIESIDEKQTESNDSAEIIETNGINNN